MEIEVFKNKIKMFDLAQADTAWSRTQRSITLRGVGLDTVPSVRQFWIFGHFNFPTQRSVILRGVGLSAE